VETMTPQECFEFALRITSNKSYEEVRERAGNMIARLGLRSCRDTYVGGKYLKGLSGGERKRTSIGYELITKPMLVLLDEPTSGLDSQTALKIA
jgi:ABC-type multidrug transport system ATPase subunit